MMMNAQPRATVALFFQTARIPLALTSVTALKAELEMANLVQVI